MRFGTTISVCRWKAFPALCTGWRPEKRGGGFHLPAPSFAIFFEKGRFRGSKQPFPKKKSPLNLTGQKNGPNSKRCSKNSTSREYARKTEQFLILSDNTARSKISTCPIHVSKNQPFHFFRWVFFADFSRKLAIKLSEKWKSQLVLAMYQKLGETAKDRKTQRKTQQVRRTYKNSRLYQQAGVFSQRYQNSPCNSARYRVKSTVET